MQATSLRMLFAIAAVTITSTVLAVDRADDPTLKAIAAYRQWTRVNPEPVKVEVPVTVEGNTTSIRPEALS